MFTKKGCYWAVGLNLRNRRDSKRHINRDYDELFDSHIV